MYVKYINLRRCREEDHLNHDWSSNNYHLNCFLEISPGRPIRLLLWSTGHINQCPNVFSLIHLRFYFFPSVRSSHYSQITSGRNSTRVPLKKNSGILTVSFSAWSILLHLQLCWKDDDYPSPFEKSYKEWWTFEQSEKVHAANPPRMPIVNCVTQRPRYRGNSDHGRNWQRPKIELRFHHRSLWRCPYTLWP